MAVWTYIAALAPKEELNKIKEVKYGSIFNNNLWRNRKIPFDLEKELSLDFIEAKSWSENLRIWEKEENGINIFYDNESPILIQVKIHLGEPNIKILKKFIDLAIRLDCYIVSNLYNDFHILEPNMKAIIEDIKLSPAHKFMSNPNAYLDNLDKYNIDD